MTSKLLLAVHRCNSCGKYHETYGTYEDLVNFELASCKCDNTTWRLIGVVSADPEEYNLTGIPHCKLPQEVARWYELRIKTLDS